MAKYQTIIDWINKNIDEGKLSPGEKIPSENILCEKFGLSRQTVRHAISKLSEDGLLESRRGSGTYVADQRADGSNKSVVAVVTTYLDDYIFPSTIRGIESSLSSKGYSMQLSFTNNTTGKEKQILEDLIERNDVAGVIMEPVKSALPNPNIQLYHKLIDKGIKVLFINSYYPELDLPHVSINDEECAYRAVKALADAGHRNIGCVLKLDDGQGRERYRGYLRAMTECGLSFTYDHVNWIDTIDIKDGKRSLVRVKERLKGCSAVFCYNDQVAGMLMQVLIEDGMKLPEEMSVIGMDDSDLAKIGVSGVTISSIPHPKARLGNKAAQNMIRLIHSSGKFCNATYEFEEDVIIRDSIQELSGKNN
ncbi:GntR family transcriptional regulator [Butyrivibrio sp. YAB3001]|uniref:GntR family transcriptional regulator n=1 Tax=Butyrivibrio sp. YAB3001 TaxID=1520812 RepID=UPI0008F68B19|nr:GntR family transcriptional regulator [Butyrivibrio sp. YAB3001]SFC09750.1 GntR family transcriptional regulator, arabinose operon transcriptional repressor [Butyrivibrio sp. YAB3001]